jgi:hypothetical protein
MISEAITANPSHSVIGVSVVAITHNHSAGEQLLRQAVLRAESYAGRIAKLVKRVSVMGVLFHVEYRAIKHVLHFGIPSGC